MSYNAEWFLMTLTPELWGVVYGAVTASVAVAFVSIGIPLIRYGLWSRRFRGAEEK